MCPHGSSSPPLVWFKLQLDPSGFSVSTTSGKYPLPDYFPLKRSQKRLFPMAWFPKDVWWSSHFCWVPWSRWSLPTLVAQTECNPFNIHFENGWNWIWPVKRGQPALVLLESPFMIAILKSVADLSLSLSLSLHDQSAILILHGYILNYQVVSL